MLKLRSLLTALTVAAASLGLSGCILAPGMHMDTQQLTPSVNANGNIVTPSIIPITAQLILQQQKQAEIESALAIRNYVPPKGFTSNTSDYEYHIGPHDVLSIALWNYPMLGTSTSGNTQNSSTNAQTTTLEVNAQGAIFYPYLGNILVAGKTPEQVRQLMAKRLAQLIKDPQVTVSISQYSSQQITVTGAVSAPQVIPVTDTPLTVLDAVVKANPLQCAAASSGVIPLCADTDDVVVEQAGVKTTVNVNTLRAPNGTSTNWILENGARIYVPNNNQNTVFILGAVNAPGPYNMGSGHMTLEMALGNAGGASNVSNPEYTYIIRNYHANPTIFSIDASSPDAFNLASEFLLKPQDVIFVSTSRLETFNEVLTQINQPLTTAVYINSLAH